MRSHGDFARHRPRRNRRRPKGRRHVRRPARYKVTDFIGAYLLGMAGFFVSLSISPVLAILAYVFIGILLSRFIGERVDWWVMTSSIKNVAAMKLHSVFTWPVSVPVFIAQVFVAKFL